MLFFLRVRYSGIGTKNTSVESEKIILQPLHIKLEKYSSAFQLLKQNFFNFTEAKIKEVVFVGPVNKKLNEDSSVISTFNDMEK